MSVGMPWRLVCACIAARVADSAAQCVATAGTFDYLHAGHRVLLTLAALCASEELIIGVLSEFLTHCTCSADAAQRQMEAKNIQRNINRSSSVLTLCVRLCN